MGAGILLAAYGEENIVLNGDPQITFFKIVYRRYTNFSSETVRINFNNQINFGKKYSVEITKQGDLLNKMWLIIDLPDIPKAIKINNDVDMKAKFKWTRKIAYALVDYVEIEIGGQVISKQWGEWMNVLEELNWNNFNSSLDEYIGNTPELTTYRIMNDNKQTNSKLCIPLYFWFCNNAGSALPLICLEGTTVRFNVQLNEFKECAITSPSNYIQIKSYAGNGILGEPLLQVSNQGQAWGEFDSLDVATYDKGSMNVLTYNLYYRKISDNPFITSSNTNNINLGLINLGVNFRDYIIYGLYSGAVYIPVQSNENNANSIYIEKNYNINIPKLLIKDMYLLCDYIYIDKEERTRFYQNKHEYIVEQVYHTAPQKYEILGTSTRLELINPCKYIVFSGQVSYFLNENVNEKFNYNLNFFDYNKVKEIFKNNLGITKQKTVIKNANFEFNSNILSEEENMETYSNLQPFLSFPMAKNHSGFGLYTFSLYPNALQPSGSCNMSYFNNFSIKTQINPIDITFNKYYIKTYAVVYNFFIVSNGVAGCKFYTAY